MRSRSTYTVGAVILLALLGGCSTQSAQVPSAITVTELDDGRYRLSRSVEIKAKSAESTVLRSGSTWKRVGTIAEGNVYSTKDQLVIVNSFNVHEADIVARDGYIVGYYLKVPQAFLAVEPVPVTLELAEN